MKKILAILTITLTSTSIGFCQFGGLLGGGKKSSGTDKDAFIQQGKELIEGYALLQAAVLEVAAAQALAENNLAEAERLKTVASAIKDDPHNKDNQEKAKQETDAVFKKQAEKQNESVQYTDKGKQALRDTLPTSFATVAGAVALGIRSVDWLKEYPNQLKAAGTFGKLKLVKELKVPMTVAKELPTSLVTIPKFLKSVTATAKKQGVDTAKADKIAADLEE